MVTNFVVSDRFAIRFSLNSCWYLTAKPNKQKDAVLATLSNRGDATIYFTAER